MPDPPLHTASQIAINYAAVVRDVASACQAAGRDPSQVCLIGVSKYVDAATTAMLVAAGCHQLGESRPQTLWQKAESGLIAENVAWHMIGHVQRNKIRRMLRRPVLVHSIDSRRVAEAIGAASVDAGLVTDGLLEINISGEDAKTGLTPSDARALLASGSVRGLRWRGLMAMASNDDSAEHQFAETRALRDTLAREFELQLPELSMGMSGDFGAAIKHGSTMVRIGSRLFEGLEQ